MEKKKLQMMFKIAKRAKEQGLLDFDILSLVMDLKEADKAFSMKLDHLFCSDNANFSHDILGIQNNIDRKNKYFINEFVPRYC